MFKDVNVYSFNDECYVYLGDYKHLLDLQRSMDKQYEELEKENQQLKEQLENNDCKRIYNQFVNYKNWYFEYVDKCKEYKSVLDEIREYINKFPCIHYASSEKVDGKRLSGKLIPSDDLIQILDKVKE